MRKKYNEVLIVITFFLITT